VGYRRQAPAKKKLRTFSKGVRPECEPCPGTPPALQMNVSSYSPLVVAHVRLFLFIVGLDDRWP
jgi:hypothetical protein